MAEEKKSTTTKKTASNEKFMPILVLIIGVLAFAVGMLWQKVNDLETTGTTAGAVADNGNPAAPAAPADGKLSADQAAKLPEVTEADYIKGSPDAEIILVEYSDLECPFCGRFHPTAQQALDEYGDQIAWVYRHFPLDAIHPQARPGGIAADCVAAVGGDDAFWQFTDYVFENQTTALTDLVASAQTSTGIDIAACLEAGDDSKVEEQYQGGLAAGVNGTPGNFIINKDGEVWSLPGAVPYPTLKATIEEALGN